MNDDVSDTLKSDKTQPPGPVSSIGRSMARMRMMIGRRFIGNLVIARVGAGMELSHLDVVSAVRRLQNRQEATVGAIAEQLRVDPSRSSRIVADLVKQGLLRREVSQEDARRAIVVITPVGQELLNKVDEVKRETINAIVADWPAEDIARFAELFERFITGFEQQKEKLDTDGTD